MTCYRHFFWNISTFSEEGWCFKFRRIPPFFSPCYAYQINWGPCKFHLLNSQGLLGNQPLGSGENHQDVRNQLRKSTRTYKDKGVLATLEIIISYIHVCICMYYSYRSAIATSSTKPIADITHWSSSCFGWDRRSSLPAGSTHAAQESIFYPRTELMWDAKKDTEAVLQVGRLVQDASIGYF